MKNNIYFGGDDVIRNKKLIAKRIIIIISIIWALAISYVLIFFVGYNKGKETMSESTRSEINLLKEELLDASFNDSYRKIVNYTGNDEKELKRLVKIKSLESSINKYKDIKNVPKEKTIPTNELLNYIIIHANKYDLDVFETVAQIAVESDFIVNAKSSANCRGLMQISEAALKEYNEYNNKDYKWEDVCTPSINIEVGCWYMRWLKDEHNKNNNDTLYHYNAGPYGRKNIQESTIYVSKINNLKESFLNDLSYTYLQKKD